MMSLALELYMFSAETEEELAVFESTEIAGIVILLRLGMDLDLVQQPDKHAWYN